MFITKDPKTNNYVVEMPKDLVKEVPPTDEVPDGKETLLTANTVLASAVSSYCINLKGIKKLLMAKKLMDKLRNINKDRQVIVSSDELTLLKNSLNDIAFTPLVFEWEDFLTFLEELEEVK